MTIASEDLEGKLGVTFSEMFRRFWNAHVPEKTPCFGVATSKLSQARYAVVRLHPEHGWLIEVRDDLVDNAELEVSLAHELFHLILYKEGYPAVCRSQEELPNEWNPDEWDEAMGLVHSILSHPVIRQRMRHEGFPIDEHLPKEIRETLEVLETYCVPDPDDFVYWRLWVLTYVLNRCDGVDQVCSYIAGRAAPVAEQGEEYSRWLDLAGYSEPGSVTVPKMIEIGRRFLELLEMDAFCLLCVMGNGALMKVPG